MHAGKCTPLALCDYGDISTLTTGLPVSDQRVKWKGLSTQGQAGQFPVMETFHRTTRWPFTWEECKEDSYMSDSWTGKTGTVPEKYSATSSSHFNFSCPYRCHAPPPLRPCLQHITLQIVRTLPVTGFFFSLISVWQRKPNKVNMTGKPCHVQWWRRLLMNQSPMTHSSLPDPRYWWVSQQDLSLDTEIL